MGYWFAIFFINVDFYSYINFSLNTPFPAFHKFWYILFLFLLFSKYVVISPMISSLTHRLFKSIFNLPIFLNLLHFLLLKLISNVIPFREENCCDFYFFLNLLSHCFVLANTPFIFCCQMASSVYVCCGCRSSCLLSYFLVLSFIESDTFKSSTITVCFFLQFSLVLLHTFWGSIVRYIHIYNCYMFLTDWFLPLYNVLFLL